jgi:hypothetical protein
MAKKIRNLLNEIDKKFKESEEVRKKFIFTCILIFCSKYLNINVWLIMFDNQIDVYLINESVNLYWGCFCKKILSQNLYSFISKNVFNQESQNTIIT